MALINCPECGHKISDKSEICVNCGFPIHKYMEEKTPCPYCGELCIPTSDYCEECGMRLTDYIKKIDNTVIENTIIEKTEPTKQFTGIYKYSLFGGQKEVYCPRCGSENCEHYSEKKIIPQKTKTSYTLNLNPFKPFTIVNKKEKVVRKDFEYTEKKIICNSCGYIF